MTITKKEFLRIAEKTKIIHSDYALDVLVRTAHHSSAIEGNSLTLSDTITIIVDEMTPSRSKSMRELYEVANHREALADVLSKVAENSPLTTQFVKQIQADLMDHLREDKGQFKSQQNAILGSIEQLAAPGETPFLMEQWAENFSWQLEHLKGREVLEALAQSHINFEHIHPFSDGNGRTGRMLLSYGALKKFGVPVVINFEQRANYIALLQTQNVEGLVEMLEATIQFEQARQKEFNYQESLNSALPDENFDFNQ